MTCKNCLSFLAGETLGGYAFGCLECCARLVVSAHPSKPQAAVMLAAIARFPGAPSRGDILACAKLKLEKPL